MSCAVSLLSTKYTAGIDLRDERGWRWRRGCARLRAILRYSLYTIWLAHVVFRRLSGPESIVNHFLSLPRLHLATHCWSCLFSLTSDPRLDCDAQHALIFVAFGTHFITRQSRMVALSALAAPCLCCFSEYFCSLHAMRVYGWERERTRAQACYQGQEARPGASSAFPRVP